VLAHLDELGPAFEIGLQPAEQYFRQSELKLQAIEQEPVVDGVEGRRQIEANQDSDLLVVGGREDSFSSAVFVECPFLYADWNWLKLTELSRWAAGVPTRVSPGPWTWSASWRSACSSLAVYCRARPSSAVEATALSCIGQETFQSAVTGWRVWQWLARTRERTTSVTSTAGHRVMTTCLAGRRACCCVKMAQSWTRPRI